MSRFETPEECERTLVAVRELSAAIELEDVMRIVRRAVRALASADGATFVLREGEQVFYADEDAIAPLWKGRRFALDACVSGWAIAHRETVVIPDVDHDPRIPHEVYDATFVKSLAIVPIRTADPLGAIGAYWARSHTVSARVVDILQMLADAAGVALERAALVSAERRARSDAERLRDAQGDLIRIVAHDIRNPLNAMMMSATLLQQVSNDTPLGQRVRRQASVIQRAGGRIGRLVGDLSDYGALQAGVFRVEPTPQDVATLLHSVEELEIVAESTNHPLLIESPEEGLRVLAEPDRVAQVLANLVRNAIEHTPAGTSIFVSAFPSGNDVAFAVRDTGSGIPPEIVSTLFARYGQRNKKARGTGLGLFIVKGVVEAHGGSVAVETSPSGTTFRFRLPRA